MSDNNSPLIRFTPEKSSYYSDDSKTKPMGASGSGKDFKKILSKERREGDGGSVAKRKTKVGESEDEAREGVAELGEEEKPSGSVSLFDLSKGNAQNKKAPQNAPNTSPFGIAGKSTPDTSDEPVVESPSTMFAKNAIKGEDKISETLIKTNKLQNDSTADPIQLKSFDSELTVRSKSSKDNSKFATEQTDLSYVNPYGNTTMQTSNVTASTSTRPISSVDMQAMIDKLVKEVQVMEANGKTETTIVLKHPPLLEGANITVTAFNHAAKEFNISFDNLTQAGQQLLSQQAMRADLLHSLEQKGYNVHILTTTTYDENRIFTAEANESQRDRGDREERHREDSSGRERNREG